MSEDKKSTELGNVSQIEIDAINQEIELKESQKIMELKSQLESQMKKEAELIKSTYDKEIKALQKSLEDKNSDFNVSV